MRRDFEDCAGNVKGCEARLDRFGGSPVSNPWKQGQEIGPHHNEYIKGKNSKEKWQRELDKFSLFAGRALSVDKGIDDSEIATNQHNRALAWLFKSFGYLQGDPADAVTRYTRACSVAITCGIWP